MAGTCVEAARPAPGRPKAAAQPARRVAARTRAAGCHDYRRNRGTVSSGR